MKKVLASSSANQESARHQERGQSLIEIALTLPLLVLLLVGLVEVAFVARTYLVLLEATREGARLGARGAANFDNSEILALVQQNLSREGLSTATGLADVIIVRADVGPGAVVSQYDAYSMLGGGRAAHLSPSTLLSRLAAGDPQTRLIGVEIYYNQRSLLGFPLISDIFPDPLVLHAYSIMRVLQ
jgi:Flp pilus assembly protein TadG